MRLSEDDVTLFYKLNPALLFFVNQKLKIINKVSTLDDFMSLPIEKKVKVRNALYEHIDLIDPFTDQNPFDFSQDELEIVRSWKNFVKGTFYLFRYLKKYAVFLNTDSPPKAYGVLGLWDRLDDIFPYPPLMVDTVLLPFKNQIVYDAFISPYPITFGGGIRQSLSDAYQEAKARFGIITTLPFVKGDEQSDEEKLKFYLTNERNRELYWDEIQDLIHENPDLMVLYHQEMGKSHARTYGKKLREIGFSNAWFAIAEGIIVAGGATKDKVEQALQDILPPEKRKFVYLFQLK